MMAHEIKSELEDPISEDDQEIFRPIVIIKNENHKQMDDNYEQVFPSLMPNEASFRPNSDSSESYWNVKSKLTNSNVADETSLQDVNTIFIKTEYLDEDSICLATERPVPDPTITQTCPVKIRSPEKHISIGNSDADESGNKNDYNRPKYLKLFHRQKNLKKNGSNCSPPIYNIKWLQCAHCDKDYRYRSHLIAHMKKHVPNIEVPFTCSRCSKKFCFRSELVQHEQCHGDREKLFKCPHCDRRYARKKHLTDHIKAKHFPRFLCYRCDKGFHCTSALNQHMTVHTDEKLYECFHCTKRFKTKLTLKRHIIRSHFPDSVIRRFICSKCDKRFECMHLLKSHSLIHTHERPFKCSHCDKLFKHERSLNSHVNNSHRIFS